MSVRASVAVDPPLKSLKSAPALAHPVRVKIGFVRINLARAKTSIPRKTAAAAKQIVKRVVQRKAVRSAKPSAKKPVKTDEELIQDIAIRAERKIDVSGSAAGSRKHKYAADLLQRYQNIFGQRTHIQVEKSYLKGK